ncbi:MAG TPA: nucleoside triphosphate pyrophosphohydrolase [Clostridia bacterium]
MTKEVLKNKQEYSFEDLIDIMKILMGPDGCPWDKAQTHQSIRMNAIEEAYEVVDAIDQNDKKKMVEELGDLLLQSIFHCMIAERDSEFTLKEVIDALCKKLIFRHQHVFGEVKAQNAAEALSTWNSAKAEEKHLKTVTQDMKELPKHFPELLRAQKVQKKAASVGFDFETIEHSMQKTDEEIAELKAELKSGNIEKAKKELGDCLFSLVNMARMLKADAELCLKATTDKFINRFEQIENAVIKSGKPFSQYTLEELDKIYDQAKERE